MVPGGMGWASDEVVELAFAEDVAEDGAAEDEGADGVEDGSVLPGGFFFWFLCLR